MLQMFLALIGTGKFAGTAPYHPFHAGRIGFTHHRRLQVTGTDCGKFIRLRADWRFNHSQHLRNDIARPLNFNSIAFLHA